MSRGPKGRTGAADPAGGVGSGAPDETVDAHIGRRIRVRRVLLGLSLSALARAVGLSHVQLQYYETGTNKLSASTLHDLATALGVPIGYFYEGLRGGGAARAGVPEDERGMPGADRDGRTQKEVGQTQKEVLALVRAFDRIADPEGRKAVLDLVKRLAKR